MNTAATIQLAEQPKLTSAPRSKMFAIGNRPALTGFRALLIGCILVYHSNFTTMPGAWAALGAFFVLSGFLITVMLATEHQKTGGIKLMRFYSRRSARLLPPLFMTVALLALYASFVRISNAADHVWADVAGAVFYYADYRSALGHGSPFGFLSQCWSLAVEEQFYLVWAMLLFAALKYGSRKLAYAIAIIGFALSMSDRLWIVLHAPVWNTAVAGRVYYAFDTRADALFVGCLLGLVATGSHLDGWKPWAKRILIGNARWHKRPGSLRRQDTYVALLERLQGVDLA
jgi:peptidoglycan/LPS O-acetylase OafA/YrhL